VVPDIGFGDGEALAADDLTNVRSVCADAAEVLSDHLAAVNLFFPDPWPKNRPEVSPLNHTRKSGSYAASTRSCA
jgi:tRNA G46 methylase TrmB